MIVSNIGATPDFSSIYTTNSASTPPSSRSASRKTTRSAATNTWHRVKQKIASETAGTERLLPVRRAGGRGAEPGPARADRRAGGGQQHAKVLRHGAQARRASIRTIPGVTDVFIPQDIDYPALRLDIDRMRASELGLDQREVVNNVITALTSNQMIAPSYWVDPKTGNDYMLTVQYPETPGRRPRATCAPSRCAAPAQPAADAARHGQRRSAASSRPPRWITTRCAAPSTSTSAR